MKTRGIKADAGVEKDVPDYIIGLRTSNSPSVMVLMTKRLHTINISSKIDHAAQRAHVEKTKPKHDQKKGQIQQRRTCLVRNKKKPRHAPQSASPPTPSLAPHPYECWCGLQKHYPFSAQQSAPLTKNIRILAR